MICGRYEGVDERVAEHLADEEISVGDYVLSGGELAAAVVIDAVARLLAGCWETGFGSVRESFRTRGMPRAAWIARNIRGPAEFRGWKVPEVLLGGNHEEIRRWRRRLEDGPPATRPARAQSVRASTYWQYFTLE